MLNNNGIVLANIINKIPTEYDVNVASYVPYKVNLPMIFTTYGDYKIDGNLLYAVTANNQPSDSATIGSTNNIIDTSRYTAGLNTLLFSTHIIDIFTGKVNPSPVSDKSCVLFLPTRIYVGMVSNPVSLFYKYPHSVLYGDRFNTKQKHVNTSFDTSWNNNAYFRDTFTTFEPFPYEYTITTEGINYRKFLWKKSDIKIPKNWQSEDSPRYSDASNGDNFTYNYPIYNWINSRPTYRESTLSMLGYDDDVSETKTVLYYGLHEPTGKSVETNVIDMFNADFYYSGVGISLTSNQFVNGRTSFNIINDLIPHSVKLLNVRVDGDTKYVDLSYIMRVSNRNSNMADPTSYNRIDTMVDSSIGLRCGERAMDSHGVLIDYRYKYKYFPDLGCLLDRSRSPLYSVYCYKTNVGLQYDLSYLKDKLTTFIYRKPSSRVQYTPNDSVLYKPNSLAIQVSNGLSYETTTVARYKIVGNEATLLDYQFISSGKNSNLLQELYRTKISAYNSESPSETKFNLPDDYDAVKNSTFTMSFIEKETVMLEASVRTLAFIPVPAGTILTTALTSYLQTGINKIEKPKINLLNTVSVSSPVVTSTRTVWGDIDESLKISNVTQHMDVTFPTPKHIEKDSVFISDGVSVTCTCVGPVYTISYNSLRSDGIMSDFNICSNKIVVDTGTFNVSDSHVIPVRVYCLKSKSDSTNIRIAVCFSYLAADGSFKYKSIIQDVTVTSTSISLGYRSMWNDYILVGKSDTLLNSSEYGIFSFLNINSYMYFNDNHEMCSSGDTSDVYNMINHSMLYDIFPNCFLQSFNMFTTDIKNYDGLGIKREDISSLFYTSMFANSPQTPRDVFWQNKNPYKGKYFIHPTYSYNIEINHYTPIIGVDRKITYNVINYGYDNYTYGLFNNYNIGFESFSDVKFINNDLHISSDNYVMVNNAMSTSINFEYIPSSKLYSDGVRFKVLCGSELFDSIKSNNVTINIGDIVKIDSIICTLTNHHFSIEGNYIYFDTNIVFSKDLKWDGLSVKNVKFEFSYYLVNNVIASPVMTSSCMMSLNDAFGGSSVLYTSFNGAARHASDRKDVSGITVCNDNIWYDRPCTTNSSIIGTTLWCGEMWDEGELEYDITSDIITKFVDIKTLVDLQSVNLIGKQLQIRVAYMWFNLVKYRKSTIFRYYGDMQPYVLSTLKVTHANTIDKLLIDYADCKFKVCNPLRINTNTTNVGIRINLNTVAGPQPNYSITQRLNDLYNNESHTGIGKLGLMLVNKNKLKSQTGQITMLYDGLYNRGSLFKLVHNFSGNGLFSYQNTNVTIPSNINELYWTSNQVIPINNDGSISGVYIEYVNVSVNGDGTILYRGTTNSDIVIPFNNLSVGEYDMFMIITDIVNQDYIYKLNNDTNFKVW